MTKKFKHIKNKCDFIERANMIHDFKYDYSKVEFPKREMLYSYNGEKTRKPPEYYREAKIIITCPKHGDFMQTARKHIEKNGSGCHCCAREKTSKALRGRTLSKAHKEAIARGMPRTYEGMPVGTVREWKKGSYEKTDQGWMKIGGDKKADYIATNVYEVVDDMIVVKFTPSDGMERNILIDKQDEEILSVASWRTTGHEKSRKGRTNYCVTTRNKRLVDEGYEWLGTGPKMHRLIVSRMLKRPLQKGEHVDHINHNGLDNRRQNLRITTGSQNSANVKKQAGSHTSKYKGVCFDKSRNRWMSYIGSANSNGIKREYLGNYPPTPEGELQAAAAYDRRAIELWGEFAFTNFPKEDYKNN